MSTTAEHRRQETERPTLENLTVRDLMRRHVVTVSPDFSLRALTEILEREGVSGAPVVSDDGDVVGVVSMTDIVRYLAENGTTGRTASGYFELPDGPPWFPGLLPENPAAILEAHTVAEIMTPARFTVRPQASVSELARFLLRGRIHRALVFGAEGLIGIVTTMDVLRAIAGEVNPGEVNEVQAG